MCTERKFAAYAIGPELEARAGAVVAVDELVDRQRGRVTAAQATKLSEALAIEGSETETRERNPRR